MASPYATWVNPWSVPGNVTSRNMGYPAPSAGISAQRIPSDDPGGAYRNAGYEFDPVKGEWVRSPTSAGTRVNQYETAAMGGSLQALMQQFGMNGLSGITGSGSSGSGGSGSGGTGPGGTGGAGYVSPITPPDMTASNTAVFSRAKDTAGSLARASLNSLNGELGASGMIGSGAQVQGNRDIIQSGAGMLADVNRQSAITEAGQNADFAKLGYTGSITQRGQDIQQQEANAQLASLQQDRYLKQLQLLMQTYGMFSGGKTGFTGF